QLDLADGWRSAKRQVPLSQSYPAQRSLIECISPADEPLLTNKYLFAARCREAGLPSATLLGEFLDGRPNGKLEDLPATDLFSKPTASSFGRGANLWRYDRDQDCFFNAVTDQRFSREAMLDHLRDVSRRFGAVILQQRHSNH